MKRRFISLCLCLVMVLTLLPVSAWAAEATFDVFDKDGVQVASQTSLTYHKADNVNGVIAHFSFTENVGDYTDTITAVQSDAASCDWIVKPAGKKPVYMYLKTVTVSYGSTVEGAYDVYDRDGVQVASQTSLTFFKADSANGVIPHYTFTENVGDYTDTITAVKSDAANCDWIVKPAGRKTVHLYLKEIAGVTYDPNYTKVTRFVNLGTKCGQFDYNSNNFTADNVFYTAVDGNGDVILFVKDDTGNCRLNMGNFIIVCARIGKLSECVVQHTWEVDVNDMSAVCTACGATGTAYESLGDVPSGATYDSVGDYYVVAAGASELEASVVTSDGISLQVISATYENVPNEHNPGSVGFLRYRFQVLGPESVRNVMIVGWSETAYTEEMIQTKISGMISVWKEDGENGGYDDVPFQTGVGHPVYEKHLGKTLYVLLCGVDEDIDSVGYCVISVQLPQGTQNDNPITWVLDDNGTLTISGSGAMQNYQWSGAPWYEQRSGVRKVVVEKGVTAIGDDAFCDCNNLSDVVISEGVVAIGRYVFSNCWNLTAVTIPASVVSLSASTFDYCSGLNRIDVAQGNTRYRSVDGVLYTADGKTLIRCPIGRGVYTLPTAVTSIDDQAFYNGQQNEFRVEQGNTVYSAKNGMLYTADGETLVQAPGGVNGECILPDGVVTVGPNAFAADHMYSTVTLPKSVMTVSYDAFFNNYNLKTVNVHGDGVYIGKYAFSYCSSPITIVFSGSAPTIEGSAFNGTEAAVYYPAGDETWTEAVRQNYGGTLTWESYAPGQTVVIASGACGAEGADLTWTLDTEGTLTISGSGAMKDCDSIWDVPWADTRRTIQKVRIGQGVTTIGRFAFYDFRSLTEVTIADSVTVIGRQAFLGCSELKTVSLPNGVTDIRDFAFGNCKKLTAVTVPAAVSSMGNGAFSNCSALTAIAVAPGNVSYVALDGVLFTADRKTLVQYPAGKTGSYAIPANVTEVKENAFYACEKLTEVTVPESVESIGDYAFYGCSAMPQIIVAAGNVHYASVDGILYTGDQKTLLVCPAGKTGRCSVPEGVCVISDGAFQECTEITSVTLPESLRTIGQWAFSSCHSLSSVALPGVTSVGYGAFAFCDALAAITIPASVTALGDWAFEDCGSLQTIVFRGNAPQIGEYTFCNVNATVYYPTGDASWTEAVRQNYNGVLIWKSRADTVPVVAVIAPTSDVPFTVTLKDQEGHDAEPDVTGQSLTLDGLADGTYTLEVAQTGCVTRTVTVVIDDTADDPVPISEVTLVQVGNLNGAKDVSGEETGVDDMQCLFEYLSTNVMNSTLVPEGETDSQKQAENEAYFKAVADVNDDDEVNILDYQALYEMVAVPAAAGGAGVIIVGGGGVAGGVTHAKTG